MGVTFEVIEPFDYNNIKLYIKYAFGNTRFGTYLIGTCNGKICFLNFCPLGSQETSMQKLQDAWPGAIFEEDKTALKVLEHVFQDKEEQSAKVLVMGTKLQVVVWQELLNISRGKTITYNDLAERVGNPRAVRAVASAVGKNKIAYLLPCHRVVHKSGTQVKYGSGPDLKLKILDYEKQFL